MPSLAFLINKINKSYSVTQIKKWFNQKDKILVNCNEPFRPALLASVYAELSTPLVVVCPTAQRAKNFFEQLSPYLTSSELLWLPDWESFIFEPMRPDSQTIALRMQTLNALAKKKKFVLVLSVSNLQQKLPAPQEKIHKPIYLHIGQQINTNKLILDLVKKGYVRQALVEKPGDFSVRGGVIDVFPATGQPVRIDFFGSEIETIKRLDVDEQTSKEKIVAVKIYAVNEYEAPTDNILTPYANNTKNLTSSLQDVKHHDTNALAPHQYLPKIHKLVPVSAYFLTEPVYVIDELSLVKEAAKQQKKLTQFTFEELEINQKTNLTLSDYYSEYTNIIQNKQLIMATLSTQQPDVTVNAKRVEPINGRLDILKDQFWFWQRQNYLICAALPEKGEFDRLKEVAADLGIPVATSSLAAKSLNVVQAAVAHGYAFLEAKIVCFGYQDIWPRTTKIRETPVRRKNLSFDFDDLKTGDLLVHEIHGIARFGGLLEQEVAGVKREYLLLEYAEGDKLYLPTEQLHKVTRYLGPEASKPPISRLNSTDWLQTKRRVQKSIKKLAVDLLKLYATRAQAIGYAFSPDTLWQKELEASFAYTETKDQLEAINEVKQDMEKPRPMDRLICGDVGYGKTEVALRAAFKAIMDGKQVLLLAPTTVLVQQHYLNFKERLAPFPVEIAQLSRFLPPQEQKQVVEKVKVGLIDLVIGTHRLLQKDVKFKNLGLVIIDEEHRFGVNHKEKLRDLKKNVDVLSMSATPIPRTLQMSLSGVRDLSIIETPPEGRQPVLTYIGEFQPALITAAIRRELSRHGQVFYLANKVSTIEHTARKVKQMVPEAKISIAHGQMPVNKLEKVMLDFLKQKINVLVCTTIIESGLDITNANTLIVEEADRFGLSQLYQLRGRIGRSRQRGFAYFTYKPGKDLTATALARLKTMGEYTELGSGFKIALKDLEIRGAGNILGPEQHGHIASVGFDLYCQLLKNEIDNLEHRLSEEAPEVQIDLPVEAFIPKEYIENESLRLQAYRQIALASNKEELDKLAEAFIDKYGRLPQPLRTLLDIANLKITAAKVGIEKIRQLNNRLYLKLKQAAILGGLPRELDCFVKGNTGELVIKLPQQQKNVMLFLEEIFAAIIPASKKVKRYS